MRRNRRIATASFSFNATAMVDVIFTLTIFFMLVARFSSAELVSMELPDPQDSQASIVQHPERVVINCMVADGDSSEPASVLYSLGPNPPEPLTAISDRLIAMKRAVPGLAAVVRADRRLPYADVRAVLRALADAEIEVLNVAARVDEEQ
jgi:biopolymer transport protein ExbD